MILGVSNGSEVSSLNNKNINNNKTSSNKLNKIELVKKGEPGYLKAMDEDDDGIVTMEEFNNYCAENGVSEDEKLKLLSTINAAKQSQKINDQMQAKQKEEKETEETSKENKIIYAKKGDDKYNLKMDENQDDVVTYEEYIKYCQNKKQNEKQTDNKIEQTYSQEETPEEDITIETEA